MQNQELQKSVLSFRLEKIQMKNTHTKGRRQPCWSRQIRQRVRMWVRHVYGDGTNQDTLLCCRVWSVSRALHKPGPRLRSHTSWFVSWNPAHRSQSTDSMTTTPPIDHALQTPTNIRTNTTWR